MAQQTIVNIVDDLDGSVLRNGRGETVLFGLDGVAYEIDLSKKNATKLRADFSMYVQAGRRIPRQSRAKSDGSAKRDANQTKAIRGWAQSNGYPVSGRGRIPAAVIAAYQEAH